MSLVPNLALGGSSGNQGYNIQRSLRFRSSASANLTRTFGSGNQTTSTLSLWCKRGKIGSQQNLMGVSGGGSNDTELFFGADDLTFTSWNGGSRPLGNITTTAVFRDTSAWYHIVLVVDTSNVTSTERLRLYVNGIRQTVTGAYPSQNATWYWNGANAHTIGVYANPTGQAYFDGYLAEVNFIDGQALTPSSFGQTDAVTGVWVAKKYTGTYGTNGFYLPFSNNTSATTLAYDFSGNGNNWTANNISTTAGATYDSMTDVPMLTSATAANYAVMNPLVISLSSGGTANGNLQIITPANSSKGLVTATFGVSSGKWYWEQVMTADGSLAGGFAGIYLASAPIDTATYLGQNSYGYSYYNSGSKYNNASAVAYGASWTVNDVIGTALDMDAGTIAFYKNGVAQGTAFTGLSGVYCPATSDGGTGTITVEFNFGQRPFSYTPPTGFVALNTFNLPDPTIKKPNQYMDATLWTGNGSQPRSITNAGAFQPDFVWAKKRGVNTANHVLCDAVRGTTASLASNTTAAELTSDNTNGWVSAYNSNGFTVSGTNAYGVNENGETYVGWQWKKGATPGFDIVTYTGDGTTGQVTSFAHNLGITPKLYIIKQRNGVNEWYTFTNASGSWQYGLLNSTGAFAATAQYANSTRFYVSGTSTNTNGGTYVAYLFSEIPGFSKFGSYTGNGSADGPFVYCGFRPKYLMVKRTDTTGNWLVEDGSRDIYNPETNALYANLSNAESSGYPADFVSNGFKFRSATDTDRNASGGTYIFCAFAENPFKYSLAR